MKTKIIKFSLFIMIVVAIVVVSGCTTQNEVMTKEESNDVMVKVEDNDVMVNTENEDVMVKIENDDSGMEKYNGEVLAGSTTPYISFNKEDYDKAVSDDKIILLYFYADWCPSCKAEQVDTFAAFDELDRSDVIGFRVNYRDSGVDKSEEALAKEHGITYQHTKVIIQDGKRVLKAPNSWAKEKYLEEINKVK